MTERDYKAHIETILEQLEWIIGRLLTRDEIRRFYIFGDRLADKILDGELTFERGNKVLTRYLSSLTR